MQVELSKEEMDMLTSAVEQYEKIDCEESALWEKIKDKFKNRQEVEVAARKGFEGM